MRLGGLSRVTQPIVIKQWPSRWAMARCHLTVLLFAFAVLFGPPLLWEETVRTKLQKGEVGVGEGEQVGSGGMKGMVQTTSSDRSLCSTRNSARAERDSHDPVHWISNQTECLCHPGHFKQKTLIDSHCSPWIYNRSECRSWSLGECSESFPGDSQATSES